MFGSKTHLSHLYQASAPCLWLCPSVRLRRGRWNGHRFANCVLDHGASEPVACRPRWLCSRHAPRDRRRHPRRSSHSLPALLQYVSPSHRPDQITHVATGRFYGFTENDREVEMDMREMVGKVKQGEPLYGKSGMSEYLQGVAARNSRYSELFIHVLPWINIVNHDQVGFHSKASNVLQSADSMNSTVLTPLNTTSKPSGNWKLSAPRHDHLGFAIFKRVAKFLYTYPFFCVLSLLSGRNYNQHKFSLKRPMAANLRSKE